MRARWSLAFLLPLLLALTSCFLWDDDISDLPPEEQTAIVSLLEFFSDDESFKIEIPADAVPAGTDISITAVPKDQLPDPLANLQGAGTGYQIEAPALNLDEPAVATLTLNMSDVDETLGMGVTSYGLLALNEDEEREFLPELETKYTLGDDFFTVSTILTELPELVGRTKGSFHAEMTEISTLPVGEGAAVDFTLRNTARVEDKVTLKGAVGDALANGAVSITVEPEGEPADLAAGRSASDDFDILCADDPGTGVYTLVASTSSVVEGGSPTGTPLRIVLDNPVECVEGETGSPTSPPTTLTLPDTLIDYLDAWGLKSSSQLAAVQYTQDATNDHIYGDPNQTPGFTPGYTDVTGTFSAAVTLSEDAASALTTAYPCNQETNGVSTACQENTTFPAGDAFVVGLQVDDRFPDTLDHICIASNVFDGGQFPWQAAPSYAWDFYQSTTDWYEVGATPSADWSLLASTVGEGNIPREPRGTFARFFVVPELQTIGGIIPILELPDATGYRATIDCHDEAFTVSNSGGDVSGANPTEPLLPLPDDFVPIDDICGGRCLPPDPGRGEAIL